MILSIIASLALSTSCTDLKALTIPNATYTSSQLRAEQTSTCGLLRQSPNRSQPYVDCARSQIAGFEFHSVAQYDSSIERESRF